MLFTSLLVQSQAAMMAGAANAPAGSRSRGRSFLYAYACRIDKRLAEITESVEASMSETTAEHGSRSSLLPDDRSWARGVLAADRAQLNADLPAGAPGRARSLAP